MFLSPEEIAELFLICNDVREQMVRRGVFSRRPEGTAPPGTISCGELVQLVRGFTLLALEAYPQMVDPEVVEALIRSAAVREAGGAVN